MAEIGPVDMFEEMRKFVFHGSDTAKHGGEESRAEPSRNF